MNGLRVISGCSQHKVIDQAGSIHPVWTEANMLYDKLLCRFSAPRWKFHPLLSAPFPMHQLTSDKDVLRRVLTQPKATCNKDSGYLWMYTHYHTAISVYLEPLALSPRQAWQPCKEWWPWHTLIWQSCPTCCYSLEETGSSDQSSSGDEPCLTSGLGKQNIPTPQIGEKRVFWKISDQTDWVFSLPFHSTERDETNSSYLLRRVETHNPLK